MTSLSLSGKKWILSKYNQKDLAFIKFSLNSFFGELSNKFGLNKSGDPVRIYQLS